MTETRRPEESAYRDPRDGLQQERAALLDARRRETSKLVPKARAIYPRRLARTAFGAVGVCGGVAMAAGTLLDRPGLTKILYLTWLAAILAYAVAWMVGRMRLRRALAALLSSSSDSARDVDRLERTTPLMQARRLADPIEGRSLTLPLAALGVLAPLTLFYTLALFTVPASHRLPRFDWWIELTFATAWPAFAVTGLIAYRYARRVRARTLSELMNGHENEGWGAYGWMVLAVGLWGVGRALYVLLPRANGGEAGAVALATLPVACAALVGLCYLPWMFAALHRRIAQERLHLGIELGGDPVVEVVDTTAYRDAGEGLRSEREELLVARRRELSAMRVEVVDVYARRFARVVAGATGIGVALVSTLLFAAGAEISLVFVPVGVAVTLATLIAARCAGRARIRRRLATDFAAGADVRADVDRLLRDTPFAVVRRMADAHEPWSVVLSVVAMTLLIPLAADSAFAWLAVAWGRTPSVPAALWNRLFLPQCGGVLLAGGIMLLAYSRNVRLETVNQLMSVYRGSVGEAWFTALLIGVMWGGMACGSQFLAPGEAGTGVWASLDSLTTGEMAAFFVIWGGIGVWLLMSAVSAPLFAVLHRRVEAERATLGLSARDFLRRET